MSDFATAFAPSSTSSSPSTRLATGDRRAPPRRPLARHVRGRPGRAPGLRRSLDGDVRGARSADLTPTSAIDRDLRARRARRAAVRDDRAPRGRLGPARLGLPARRRPVRAALTGVRAARRRLASRRRPPRGDPGACSTARDAALVGTEPAGRSDGSRPRPPSSQLAGVDELIEEALAEAGDARRRRSDASPRSSRASRPPRRRPAPRSTAFAAHLRDVVLPASEGEGRLGRERFAREDAPHHALRRADPGADPGRRRARVRRGPGRDGPHRPRHLADVVP